MLEKEVEKSKRGKLLREKMDLREWCRLELRDKFVKNVSMDRNGARMRGKRMHEKTFATMIIGVVVLKKAARAASKPPVPANRDV